MSRIDPTYGEMEDRIGGLEKEVKKGRADRNRLKKLEKQYAKALEERDKLSRTLWGLRSTMKVAGLYLDRNLDITGYSGDFPFLASKVVEFANQRKNIREFLREGDFDRIREYLDTIDALKDLPYDQGAEWQLRYKGPGSSDRTGGSWVVSAECSDHRWEIKDDRGKYKIIHSPHLADEVDCYLMSAAEYGDADQDLKVVYRIKTSKKEKNIRDLSLVLSGSSGRRERFCDMIGYCVCTGSNANSGARIVREGADIAGRPEKLEPDTEYRVTVERVGGRIRRWLKNLKTGKEAPILEVIDADALYDRENHVGFTTFAGELEVYDIEIFTRKSRFGIERFKIHFELEAGIKDKALEGRVFKLRLWKNEAASRPVYHLIFEDITDYKQAEEALREASRRLEERVEERTVELAEANDELRLEIAERRQAEEALRESEEKFRALAEFANDAIVLIQDKKTIYHNPAYERLIGLREAETGHLGFLDLIVPEDRERALDYHRRRLSGHEAPDQYEVDLVNRLGHRLTMEIKPRVIEYRGRPATMAVMRDITERRKMEEELRKDKATLDRIINLNPYCICIFDAQGHFIRGNQAFFDTFGQPPPDGYSIFDDPVLKSGGYQQEVLKLKKGKVVRIPELKYNLRLIRPELPDTPLLLSSLSFPILDSNRNIECIVVMHENITQHKQAEQELKRQFAAMEASMDGIAILNENEEYIYLNDAHAKVYGYDSPEELIGKTWRELYYDDEIRKFEIEVMPELWEKGRWRGEAIGRRRDGSRYHQELSLTAIDKGGLICVVRDITNRKMNEQKIQASLKEKDLLLQEIYHRVKNNLQVVSSLLNLKSKTVSDKKAVAVFDDCRNFIRVMSLVHEKLYHSNNLAHIEFKEYVSELAENLVHTFYPVGRHKASLCLDIGDVSLGINSAIPCGLVLNELITNCLKHAFPQDKPGIIRISMCNKGKNMVELVISDNGIGIPENLQPGRSKSLGLLLVSGLVKNQLRGKIRFVRNSGTEVRITFRECRT